MKRGHALALINAQDFTHGWATHPYEVEMFRRTCVLSGIAVRWTWTTPT